MFLKYGSDSSETSHDLTEEHNGSWSSHGYRRENTENQGVAVLALLLMVLVECERMCENNRESPIHFVLYQ